MRCSSLWVCVGAVTSQSWQCSPAGASPPGAPSAPALSASTSAICRCLRWRLPSRWAARSPSEAATTLHTSQGNSGVGLHTAGISDCKPRLNGQGAYAVLWSTSVN